MAAELVRAAPPNAARDAQLRQLARLLEERATRATPARRPRLEGGASVADGRLFLWLGPDETPFRIALVAGLQPGVPPLRWAIASATGDGGQDAKALVGAAAGALDTGVRLRQPITLVSGDPVVDALLGDLAPGFAALLAGLTDRQREVGRLLLVDGLRRSEVAAALGISRPTVSVMVDRARLLEVERFARGLDAIVVGGLTWTRAGP